MTDYTIESDRPNTDDIAIPEYILDRTVNILSYYPMTNQNIILDLACWWFDNAGNCGIYNWCIHHLDTLEGNTDTSIKNMDVYRDAKNQAKEIGFHDLVEEKVDEQSDL